LRVIENSVKACKEIKKKEMKLDMKKWHTKCKSNIDNYEKF